ncbi:hypothetical protein AMK31_06165 [Streptomyces sp. TSRI0107]|nr:hypothetical protein AMK31_06165 [Streptomyces sp. TSRI0107]
MYFVLSVMTTFRTTDVTVMSRETRRTVAADATIAFVFNTVIVAGGPDRALSASAVWGRWPDRPRRAA